MMLHINYCPSKLYNTGGLSDWEVTCFLQHMSGKILNNVQGHLLMCLQVPKNG